MVIVIKWCMKNADVTNSFIKIIINSDVVCQLKTNELIRNKFQVFNVPKIYIKSKNYTE